MHIIFYVKGKTFGEFSSLEKALEEFLKTDGLPIPPKFEGVYKELGYKYQKECGTILISDKDDLNISTNYISIANRKFFRCLSNLILSNINIIDESLKEKFELIADWKLGDSNLMRKNLNKEL